MRRILLAMSFTLLLMTVFALTGQGDSAAFIMDNVAPAVSIIAPNGGEDWYWGDAQQIQWMATDAYMAPNPVSVDLSINGGTNFTPLFSGIANDGTENWVVPIYTTDRAYIKIRVVDSYGNVGIRISDSAFSIGDVPPQVPQFVNMQIINNLDVLLSWSPVTHDVHNQPITPDGYIVLFNESSSTADEDFYFLGGTTQCEFLHPMVVRFRENVYYRIFAFVDPDGRIWNNLAALNPEKEKISVKRLHELCSANIGGEK